MRTLLGFLVLAVSLWTGLALEVGMVCHEAGGLGIV